MSVACNFSQSVQTSAPVKKTAKGKKKTAKKPSAAEAPPPQDLSMFDENAPSIFDDPLNALANS